MHSHFSQILCILCEKLHDKIYLKIHTCHEKGHQKVRTNNFMMTIVGHQEYRTAYTYKHKEWDYIYLYIYPSFFSLSLSFFEIVICNTSITGWIANVAFFIRSKLITAAKRVSPLILENIHTPLIFVRVSFCTDATLQNRLKILHES